MVYLCQSTLGFRAYNHEWPKIMSKGPSSTTKHSRLEIDDPMRRGKGFVIFDIDELLLPSASRRGTGGSISEVNQDEEVTALFEIKQLSAPESNRINIG